MACTSSITSVAGASRPRVLGAPGRTVSRLVPIALTWSITFCLAPSPIASMAITEATPMTMPSRVRMVRKRLARSARSAVRVASTTSDSGEVRST